MLDDVSGQRRRRLGSRLHRLDLHVHVQRGRHVHLHDDRIGRLVLFVLPGDGLSCEPTGSFDPARVAPVPLCSLPRGTSARAARRRSALDLLALDDAT